MLATPQPDPGVNAIVAYNSFWDSRYAPDSTEAALHLLVDPTARANGSFYPSDVVEDPQTHLPSHIELRVAGGNDMIIALDYKVVDGHWIIVHGTFTATEHAVVLTFKVVADVTFSDIQIPGPSARSASRRQPLAVTGEPLNEPARPSAGPFAAWRRGRDSNSRDAHHVRPLSRRVPSTTRPPLRAWRAALLRRGRFDASFALAGLAFRPKELLAAGPRSRLRDTPASTSTRWFARDDREDVERATVRAALWIRRRTRRV